MNVLRSCAGLTKLSRVFVLVLHALRSQSWEFLGGLIDATRQIQLASLYSFTTHQ